MKDEFENIEVKEITKLKPVENIIGVEIDTVGIPGPDIVAVY